MRGISLITKNEVSLEVWRDILAARLADVRAEYCELLARNEGHGEGVINTLVVDEGDHDVKFLDRPTTVREFEVKELVALHRFIRGRPRRFIAVGYSDEGLLRQVLDILQKQLDPRSVVLEDEQGGLVYLEDLPNHSLP